MLVDQEPTDFPIYSSFAAARAYRLGWRSRVGEVRPRFDDFHNRMRSYVHTPPAEPATRTVYDGIFEGFADTPYPGDDELCGSICGDDEPAESALDFRGVRWQDLHPQLVSVHNTALSFLSHSGLRYYLPAFLIADLSGP